MSFFEVLEDNPKRVRILYVSDDIKDNIDEIIGLKDA